MGRRSRGRSALKRITKFPYQAETERIIKSLSGTPKGEELEPYLKFALEAVTKQGENQPKQQQQPSAKTETNAPKAEAKSDKNGGSFGNKLILGRGMPLWLPNGMWVLTNRGSHKG